MRASIYNFKTQKFSVRDVPMPEPRRGELLIRVHYSALCGTDLHIMSGAMRSKAYDPREIVLGHAWSGVVAGRGPGVHGPRIGARVHGSDYIPCGRCERCQAGSENLCNDRFVLGMEHPGSHVEYIAVPARVVRSIPRGVGLATACFVADAVAVADQAIRRAKIGHGARVGIYGAGPVGLAIGLLLKKKYRVRKLTVIEPSPYRRRLAKTLFGASSASPETPRAFQDIFDIVYETSGSEHAFSSAFRRLCRGGELVLVGAPDTPFKLDGLKLVSRHLRISGTFTYPLGELAGAMRLAQNIRAERLITHTMPMKDIARAYRLFAQKKTGAVLLIP